MQPRPHGDAGGETSTAARRNLIVASCVAGGAAGAAVAWPFLASMQPSERARALGAPVEADISNLESGQMMIVEWQGKPVWVVRRNDGDDAEHAKKDAAQLADPLSNRSLQPEYAKNQWRARDEHKDVLVVVGICTHLGCSPISKFTPGDRAWDRAGRAASSARATARASTCRPASTPTSPRPTTCRCPRYKYLSAAKVLIGDDSKGA